MLCCALFDAATQTPRPFARRKGGEALSHGDVALPVLLFVRMIFASILPALAGSVRHLGEYAAPGLKTSWLLTRFGAQVEYLVW